MSTDPRSQALSALARFQVTDATVGQSLQRIAQIALDAISAAEVCGMSMLDDAGQPTTGIYTDETSPEVDEAQYRSARGPCLDAWRTGDVIRVDDISASVRLYPEYCEAAIEHDIMSTLSLPLATGDTVMGAMNLYGRTARCFTEQDEELGVELAGAASAVLANVSAYWTAFDLSQQLSEAMRSRAVIEQAKGILMARTADLSADEAFELLRAASQRENVKLRLIAERIVDRRRLSEPD